MKRTSTFLAIIPLLLALPLWRWMDLLIWPGIGASFYPALYMAWGLFFVLLPLMALVRRLKFNLIIACVFIGSGIWIFQNGALTRMTTKDSSYSHCAFLTYTGTFYPVKFLFTSAYRDDLEARNQFCWIVKMVDRVPENVQTEKYLQLTQDRLLSPEQKFRVNLPLIAFLYGFILKNANDINPEISMKLFLEKMNFWVDHYTAEIHVRDYGWWDEPMSSFIKWEYGLVEKNWEKIVDSIVIKN